MTELLLAGQTNDAILDSLSYRLAPTSEYIQQRRMSRFHPSGASSYSSDTTQIARIELKGAGGFLDLSTMKICFRLVNNSATQHLILSGGPHALISRIRVFCQGSLLEDCSHYGRVHHLFNELMAPSNWRVNQAIETNLQFFDPNSVTDPTKVEIIDPGEYATVLFTPSALGVVNCGKLWPVEMAPLSLEITFATPSDAVIGSANSHPAGVPSSTSYVVNNLHLQCSQVLVDSALNNSFKNLLASGRSLTISLQSVFTQAHILAANSNSAQISMVRALSKLGLLFMTFVTSTGNQTQHEVTGFGNPSLITGGSGAAQTAYSHQEYTLSLQAQLDSFLFPETPMDSQGEIFSKLQEAAATYDQKLATLSLTPQSYKDNSYCAAINFMRAPGSAFSGLNTRTGSLLTLKLNNMRTETTKVFAHLVGTILVEIRADSVSVYD
jgi:hypothetical protein